MTNAIKNVPQAVNEPILSFAPGTPEREKLKQTIEKFRSETVDVPMFIGKEEVRTHKKISLNPPHDHQHLLGYASEGDASHVHAAIEAALAAKSVWQDLDYAQRCSIFLKAADLVSGKYRYEILASTMLCQSKNVFQAEIDAACEFADFLRFNCSFYDEIVKEQPISSPGVWNQIEYRALEGFVFAISPFNFTAIAANLPCSMALMGNVCVWKPNYTQIYSANIIMKILKEAGLPDGVINLIYVDGPVAGDIIFSHRDFAGLHFTGSTGVFKALWAQIGQNLNKYRSYPRIVGETGGKDFILAHASADPDAVAVGLLRGAFEYQGQKCSAASRAYVSASIWPKVKAKMLKDMSSLKMGGTEDFSNFINAVIDEKAFDRIVNYIEEAKQNPEMELLAGGGYDKSKGYFIEPTLFLTKNPKTKTMCEEIFGPVLTLFVYNDQDFSETLQLIDSTSEYALTGAVFAQDAYAIKEARETLKYASGNFYINDKCTGAVVGQQPFGGARGSGTNDKGGSKLNLLRWISARTVKETFFPPTDYRYPFLG
jgi:1-pyrroline-5-carboxylate dehydrogenase